MPKAWLCIPSVRDEDSTVPMWRKLGYGIALFRNEGSKPVEADVLHSGTYPGYAQAVNGLVRDVLSRDEEALFLVAGGDDTEPDPSDPAVIVQSLVDHFGGTFGICQPVADRFAGGSIDNICGSPWMGREWCLRINQGRGPLWPDYHHMFVDEELQAVAIKYGALWQRPDLIHLHHHFMRESDALDSLAVKKPTPAHLVEANSPAHWIKYKAMFQDRKAKGFPGSQPL